MRRGKNDKRDGTNDTARIGEEQGTVDWEEAAT